jgi:hypothetical protein
VDGNFFDLNVDPGEGNLNARAYVASLVGPRRVFQGQRKKRQLEVGRPTEIARNASPHKEAFFVSVWIPTTLPAAVAIPFGVGLVFTFGSSEGLGDTSDVVTLFRGGSEPNRYQTVLLPNEQLYGSVIARTDGVAIPPGARVPLISSQVAF